MYIAYLLDDSTFALSDHPADAIYYPSVATKPNSMQHSHSNSSSLRSHTKLQCHYSTSNVSTMTIFISSWRLYINKISTLQQEMLLIVAVISRNELAVL